MDGKSGSHHRLIDKLLSLPTGVESRVLGPNHQTPGEVNLDQGGDLTNVGESITNALMLWL